jgi:hypothetical protein
MSIETMTKLGTVTVGSGGTANISFTNIPQTYTDLVVRISSRSVATGFPRLDISFNGSTTLSSGIRLTGNGTTVASSAIPNSPTTGYGGSSGGSDTVSTFTNTEVYIPNYTSNNYKSYHIDGAAENNATAAFVALVANLWSDTSAINSVTFADGSGTFQQHSTFTLYGIKAIRKAVGSSIKATGGAISFDGTYVIHTFNTTDVFTPTAPILVDYLVVAGGGGGGTSYGAGGGAGKFLVL